MSELRVFICHGKECYTPCYLLADTDLPILNCPLHDPTKTDSQFNPQWSPFIALDTLREMKLGDVDALLKEESK